MAGALHPIPQALAPSPVQGCSLTGAAGATIGSSFAGLTRLDMDRCKEFGDEGERLLSWISQSVGLRAWGGLTFKVQGVRGQR